ncbi:MAG: molecular chaperone HtpG [Clostridiales bacterium]|nr:molecular chaperone HtpG [Clostridiales bacterium]
MKKKPFKAESKRLLGLMINSIYTHKEIFLRELISNASDAMDKLYFKTLTEDGLSFDRSDFEIFIEADKDNRTLTIRDNGLGMTKEELENNLGTIAKSGTMDFRQENKDNLEKFKPERMGEEENEEEDDSASESQDTPLDAAEETTAAQPAEEDEAKEAGFDIDIIGQFGVGFYSAFMVSKEITVISKAYGSNEAWRWQSEGADGYSIEPYEKEGFGTTIILALKDNHDEENYSQYLDQYKIQDIVKKYSDYIRYPIKMALTKRRPKATEDSDDKKAPEYEDYQEIDTLNSMVPLWRRNKNEVNGEDYEQFYMEKFSNYEIPLTYSHISAEGTISYDGILYIPLNTPYNYYSKEYEKGLQLYANGVLIMEKCADLLPDCFSFVRGLVDSPDLSLNISREMLQQDRQVKAIAKSLDKRIKSDLLKLLKNDREKYEGFFKNFGMQLKFGIYNSFGADKDKLQDLLLYHSLKEDKMVTLAEYLEKMTEGQETIYYACGSSISRIRQLPQTELVLDKGYDILALTEDVDEFAIKIINEYQGKTIKSVSDKDLDLESKEEKEATKEQAETHKDLFTAMKEALGDKVKEVRLSKRLKSHPICLTSDGPLSIEMEKVLNSMPTDNQVKADRVLEINGNHPVFAALTKLEGSDPEKLKTYTTLLYHQALLIEGLTIEDPVSFANSICELMS